MNAILSIRAAIVVGSGVFACATAHAQGQTQTMPESPVARFVPLSDAVLAEERGGFEWGGMAISFGADMQTFLNGQLALQTIVSWTPAGATTQTTVGSSVSPASLAAMQSSGLSLPATLSGSPVYYANSGQTAIIQGANNALQNILINSAGNVSALQQTNATVTLSNYQSYASTMRSTMLGAALGNAVASFTHP